MADRGLGQGLANRRWFLKRGAAVSGLAAAVAGLAPTSALAADSGDSLLKKVLDRGKVVVGTGSTNPPWHFEDANGKLVGFDIEMGRILSKGLFDDFNKVEFVQQAADARIPNLLSDKIDIVFQFMTVTALRAQQVEFTIPYYREAVTLLFKKDSPYNSTKDLTGKKAKVAILQNPTAEDMVHRGVGDAQVLTFDSVANSVLALDSGRVDATAIDLSTAQYKTAQAPEKYKVGTDSWEPQTYAAAVKPGDQRWLNYVNTVLHEVMVGLDFPQYATAFKKYFGVDLPQPQSGFPVEFK